MIHATQHLFVFIMHVPALSHMLVPSQESDKEIGKELILLEDWKIIPCFHQTNRYTLFLGPHSILQYILCLRWLIAFVVKHSQNTKHHGDAHELHGRTRSSILFYFLHCNALVFYCYVIFLFYHYLYHINAFWTMIWHFRRCIIPDVECCIGNTLRSICWERYRRLW